MRGKAECICNSGEQYGITPAYAGKSALCRHDHSKNKDHPRLCGEKSTWTEQVPMADGSPPPMRGKVWNGCRTHRPVRITPAYAGKSKLGLIQFQHLPDHPRLCGEKCYLSKFIKPFLGSPPPMRGKEVFTDAKVTPYGITPAYAGKSGGTGGGRGQAWDHPRLCGEKITQSPTQNTLTGSPPPMRGKVYIYITYTHFTRITPAYAGKSPLSGGVRASLRDHPRLCGEKTGISPPTKRRRGSPPPMRGKGLFYTQS